MTSKRMCTGNLCVQLLVRMVRPTCAACYVICIQLCLTRSCVERRCAGSGAAIEPPPCDLSHQISHMPSQ